MVRVYYSNGGNARESVNIRLSIKNSEVQRRHYGINLKGSGKINNIHKLRTAAKVTERITS